MANYKVTNPDPSNALFDGQVVTPDYEDSKEIIIHSSMAGVMHHVKKDGEYFKSHFQEAK